MGRHLQYVFVVFDIYVFLTVRGQDRSVSTEGEVDLEEGNVGWLPCGYEWAVYAVYWYKGPSYPESIRLITLDVSGTGAKIGDGYDSGKFDTLQFSLIIYNVSFEDSGKYFCEVSDKATGILLRNHTDVYVHGRPGKPIITSVQDTVSDGRYELTWIEPRNDGGRTITHYTIYLKQFDELSDSTNGTTWTKNITYSASGAYVVNDLNECASYSIEVTASNEIGEGSPASFWIQTRDSCFLTPPNILNTLSTITSYYETPADSAGKTISSGSITAIVLCIVLVIIVIAFALICYFWKYRKSDKTSDLSMEEKGESHTEVKEKNVEGETSEIEASKDKNLDADETPDGSAEETRKLLEESEKKDFEKTEKEPAGSVVSAHRSCLSKDTNFDADETPDGSAEVTRKLLEESEKKNFEKTDTDNAENDVSVHGGSRGSKYDVSDTSSLVKSETLSTRTDNISDPPLNADGHDDPKSEIVSVPDSKLQASVDSCEHTEVKTDTLSPDQDKDSERKSSSRFAEERRANADSYLWTVYSAVKRRVLLGLGYPNEAV